MVELAHGRRAAEAVQDGGLWNPSSSLSPAWFQATEMAVELPGWADPCCGTFRLGTRTSHSLAPCFLFAVVATSRCTARLWVMAWKAWGKNLIKS